MIRWYHAGGKVSGVSEELSRAFLKEECTVGTFGKRVKKLRKSLSRLRTILTPEIFP
jgi:hypothetical protein